MSLWVLQHQKSLGHGAVKRSCKCYTNLADLKCDFTTNSHKITKQSYNITDLVQLHSHACSASVVLLLQPKQKTLQISKLKWRGKITNENVTEWNKNF